MRAQNNLTGLGIITPLYKNYIALNLYLKTEKYNNTPQSPNQKVRIIDQVLKDLIGICINPCL